MDKLMDTFEYIYSHQPWNFVICLLEYKYIQYIFLKTYFRLWEQSSEHTVSLHQHKSYSSKEGTKQIFACLLKILMMIAVAVMCNTSVALCGKHGPNAISIIYLSTCPLISLFFTTILWGWYCTYPNLHS